MRGKLSIFNHFTAAVSNSQYSQTPLNTLRRHFYGEIEEAVMFLFIPSNWTHLLLPL